MTQRPLFHWRLKIPKTKFCMSILPLLLLSSLSTAVAPIEAHFILGMDVQGQRLNLYKDCDEGYVTCDNMLLVAPNLGELIQVGEYGKRLGTSPNRVALYPAKTKHTLCKDGITPCRFQGYSFSGEDFNGFIDTSNNEITIDSNWTTDNTTLPYQENSTYLPLVSQSKRVDRLYQTSDKALNDSYRTTISEVRRLYGNDEATALKKEQRQWIKQRSNSCGADSRHEPRNQIEKVCFIQKNERRMNDYFLWID